MALWSLVIGVAGKSYSTQVEAESPSDAISMFLAGQSLVSFLRSEGLADWPTDLGPTDITLMVPMQGLVNMFACDVGRNGKYVSITLVRTEIASNSPLNTDASRRLA